MARTSTLTLATGGSLVGHRLGDVSYDGGGVRSGRVSVLQGQDGQFYAAEEKPSGWVVHYIATRLPEIQYWLFGQAARIDAFKRAVALAEKANPEGAKRGRGRPPKMRAA